MNLNTPVGYSLRVLSRVCPSEVGPRALFALFSSTFLAVLSPSFLANSVAPVDLFLPNRRWKAIIKHFVISQIRDYGKDIKTKLDLFFLEMKSHKKMNLMYCSILLLKT